MQNKMNDILTGDIKMIFGECEKEGLVRVLIYLEEFNKPNVIQQASFKRGDISIIKVWVESQKDKQRKKDKWEERIWNAEAFL